MEISKYQPTFQGLNYNHASKRLIAEFINPKECPQVLQDLKALAEKADIVIQDYYIPTGIKGIELPGIKYTVKPLQKGFKKFLGKIFSFEKHTKTLNISSGVFPYNYLPLMIEETMSKMKII